MKFYPVEMASAQRQVRDAESKEASLRQELIVLKQVLSQREAELKSASEDVMLMTRENQALTSELASSAYEREQLRKSIGEVSQRAAEFECQKTSLEAERGDLLQAYKSAVQVIPLKLLSLLIYSIAHFLFV